MVARADLLRSLGLEPVDAMGMGDFVPADPNGMAAPGIWLAGNVTDLRAQVITAAAEGVNAGAMINFDLVQEDTKRAVEARRHAADMWSKPFWDERYGSADRIWSGRPNQRLVEQVTGLTPGRALDVGGGEGADAIWLAEQGWQVTAARTSPRWPWTGRPRTRPTPGSAESITWQQADLLSWVPPEQSFDLVSAQFMHLPGKVRAEVQGRLAAAVAPGGSLLIVGHDFSDTLTVDPSAARTGPVLHRRRDRRHPRPAGLADRLRRYADPRGHRPRRRPGHHRRRRPACRPPLTRSTLRQAQGTKEVDL